MKTSQILARLPVAERARVSVVNRPSTSYRQPSEHQLFGAP